MPNEQYKFASMENYILQWDLNTEMNWENYYNKVICSGAKIVWFTFFQLLPLYLLCLTILTFLLLSRIFVSIKNFFVDLYSQHNINNTGFFSIHSSSQVVYYVYELRSIHISMLCLRKKAKFARKYFLWLEAIIWMSSEMNEIIMMRQNGRISH